MEFLQDRSRPRLPHLEQAVARSAASSPIVEQRCEASFEPENALESGVVRSRISALIGFAPASVTRTRSTRLATAVGATTRIRQRRGREHGTRYATIASVSRAACESPRSTGRANRRAQASAHRGSRGRISARPFEDDPLPLRIKLSQIAWRSIRSDDPRSVASSRGERNCRDDDSASTVRARRSTGSGDQASGFPSGSFRRRLGNLIGSRAEGWLRRSRRTCGARGVRGARLPAPHAEPVDPWCRSQNATSREQRAEALEELREGGKRSAMCPSDTFGAAREARVAPHREQPDRGASRRPARASAPARRERSDPVKARADATRLDSYAPVLRERRAAL